MTKAVQSTTTNPDAALINMTERCAALWREYVKIDEGSGGDRRVDKQMSLLCREASDLELKIAQTAAHTVKGFNEKCKAIVAAEFDIEDMAPIMFGLGRDAERLRITEAPKLGKQRYSNRAEIAALRSCGAHHGRIFIGDMGSSKESKWLTKSQSC
jgi:hypothetical protein